MARGERIEQTRTLCREREDDAAAIGGVFCAADQSFSDGTVGKLDDAVLLKAQALCQEADRTLCACRQARNLQQKLMLARLEATAVGGLLTEALKAAQRVAKLGKRLKQTRS